MLIILRIISLHSLIAAKYYSEQRLKLHVNTATKRGKAMAFATLGHFNLHINISIKEL